MFKQAFKNIDDILWKDAGSTMEIDHAGQTSWLLFLKYLNGLEQDKADEAALEGKKCTFILDEPYRWENWPAPKDEASKVDHNKALTGDDLRDFVNGKLFPYLHGFSLSWNAESQPRASLRVRAWLPAVKKQKELAENLDALHEEPQRLESLYQRKLAALDELQKALLHQTFSGEF